MDGMWVSVLSVNAAVRAGVTSEVLSVGAAAACAGATSVACLPEGHADADATAVASRELRGSWTPRPVCSALPRRRDAEE
eukprot:13502751-Heterocapsa_arctica.AAC.1